MTAFLADSWEWRFCGDSLMPAVLDTDEMISGPLHNIYNYVQSEDEI
jgi:hypothetical protein